MPSAWGAASSGIVSRPARKPENVRGFCGAYCVRAWTGYAVKGTKIDVKARPDLAEYAKVVLRLGFPLVSVQEEACSMLWSMIGDDAQQAALAAEAHAVSALVQLLDVRRDGLGVASSHNKVPSLFLAAVNALIALAQDATTARPAMVRAKTAKIAQTNVALFGGVPEALQDAVRRLVAAEAGDPAFTAESDSLLRADAFDALATPILIPSAFPATTGQIHP